MSWLVDVTETSSRWNADVVGSRLVHEVRGKEEEEEEVRCVCVCAYQLLVGGEFSVLM